MSEWNEQKELELALATIDALEVALFGDNLGRSRDELEERAELLRKTIKKQIKLRREDFKIYSSDYHLEELTDQAINEEKTFANTY